MKIEIREDSVFIDGYVNAVERESKVLHGEKGDFTEKIKSGVFQRALDRAKRTGQNVKVLLNHDYKRELTSTAETTTKLSEDNIGLRCQCEIRDKEVIQKAKEKKLSGWSFGFFCLKDEMTGEGEVKHREIRDLDLREVSILDDTKIPAYNGTSIETRSEQLGDYYELRFTNDEAEMVEKTTKEEDKNTELEEYEYRLLAVRAQ